LGAAPKKISEKERGHHGGGREEGKGSLGEKAEGRAGVVHPGEAKKISSDGPNLSRLKGPAHPEL
jgi:hypothetical protein